jgi:hypothetical protein
MKKAVGLTLIVLLLLVFAPLIVSGLGVESALAGETGNPLSIEAYPSLFLPMIKTAGRQVNSVPTGLPQSGPTLGD